MGTGFCVAFALTFKQTLLPSRCSVAPGLPLAWPTAQAWQLCSSPALAARTRSSARSEAALPGVGVRVWLLRCEHSRSVRGLPSAAGPLARLALHASRSGSGGAATRAQALSHRPLLSGDPTCPSRAPHQPVLCSTSLSWGHWTGQPQGVWVAGSPWCDLLEEAEPLSCRPRVPGCPAGASSKKGGPFVAAPLLTAPPLPQMRPPRQAGGSLLPRSSGCLAPGAGTWPTWLWFCHLVALVLDWGRGALGDAETTPSLPSPRIPQPCARGRWPRPSAFRAPGLCLGSLLPVSLLFLRLHLPLRLSWTLVSFPADLFGSWFGISQPIKNRFLSLLSWKLKRQKSCGWNSDTRCH